MVVSMICHEFVNQYAALNFFTNVRSHRFNDILNSLHGCLNGPFNVFLSSGVSTDTSTTFRRTFSTHETPTFSKNSFQRWLPTVSSNGCPQQNVSTSASSGCSQQPVPNGHFHQLFLIRHFHRVFSNGSFQRLFSTVASNGCFRWRGVPI